MKQIDFAIGLIAASLLAASPAFATPTTYSISGTPTSTTGATTWNSSAAGYNATNGTDYGNSYTWNTGASAVTATAWANTGTSGKLQTAWIGSYGTAGLGVTSRPTTGNTAELTSSNTPNTSAGQHAFDNSGAYESMLFSFASAVTLNTLSIGYKGSDADATVLVYTGTGDPSASLTARTYSDLTANGWALVSNDFNLSTSAANSIANSSLYSSKYWMVSSYLGIGGNAQTGGNDATVDSFKISAVSATPSVSAIHAVPEPDSLALFGVAGVALFARRRRTAVQN